MQLNTSEAMLRAIRLREKLGSWEAVERAGRATEHTINAVVGHPDRNGSSSGSRQAG